MPSCSYDDALDEHCPGLSTATTTRLSALEDCTDAETWWKARGSDLDDPCRAESDASLVARPGLWFEDKQP